MGLIAEKDLFQPVTSVFIFDLVKRSSLSCATAVDGVTARGPDYVYVRTYDEVEEGGRAPHENL